MAPTPINSKGICQLLACAELAQLVGTLFSRPLIYGQSGDTCLAECVMVCLYPSSLSGSTINFEVFRRRSTMSLSVLPENRLPEKTIRIRSEVKCIKGDTHIQFGPYASYLWSNSRDRFAVTFYLAILFGSRTNRWSWFCLLMDG